MKVYIACLTTFAAVAMLACGSERGDSEVGSREDPLSRKAASGDIEPSVDDGTGGTRLPGHLVTVEGPTSCAPQRWDIVAEGRTCAAFAGRRGNGTWTVAPTFPDGPPSLIDTHCALTFTPDAPDCVPAQAKEAFALSCAELHSLTARSAACAANLAACAVTPGADTSAPLPFKSEEICPSIIARIDPDGGGVGYVGGCSSCGQVYGNTLYITNPFSESTVATTVIKTDGTKQQLQFTGVANSTFAVPLTGSYNSGTVAIWK